MIIVIEIILLVALLFFTVTVCVAAAYKEEIWSCIMFEDDYEDFDEIDDNLDEYYE